MIGFSAFRAKSVRAVAAAALLMLGLSMSHGAFAEALAYWNPTGTLTGGDPLPVTTVSPSLTTASAMTGGPGLTSTGTFASAFIFDNWPAGALDTTKYIAFSTTGTNVTYQNVTFSIYNNFAGSGSWEIRSSLDGYAAALSSGTFSDIIVDGQLIVADVSAVGVQSGTVGFRVYTYNNAGDPPALQRGIRGTTFGGVGLTVNGIGSAVVPVTVAQPVPLFGPATLAVMALLVLSLGWAALRRKVR